MEVSSGTIIPKLVSHCAKLYSYIYTHTYKGLTITYRMSTITDIWNRYRTSGFVHLIARANDINVN